MVRSIFEELQDTDLKFRSVSDDAEMAGHELLSTEFGQKLDALDNAIAKQEENNYIEESGRCLLQEFMHFVTVYHFAIDSDAETTGCDPVMEVLRGQIVETLRRRDVIR